MRADPFSAARRRGVTLGAACFLSATAARAAPPPATALERPAFSYRAPPECPALPAFAARSLDSLQRLGFAARLEIVVSAHARGFAGEIELLEAGTERWARVIVGADCDEVVSALALSLAIHLDGAPARSDAAPPTRAEAPANAVDRRPASDASAAPRGARWYLALAAGGALRTGLGEAADPSVLGGLEASSSGHLLQSYRLGFELGTGAARPVYADLSERYWDHRWWTTNVQACVWGFSLSLGFELQPCFAAHLGRYSAELESRATRARWLGFIELAARARLRLERWSLTGEFGGSLPVAPLTLERQDQLLFRQKLGLVGALTLAFALAESKEE